MPRNNHKSGWLSNVPLDEQERICMAIATHYPLISLHVTRNGCDYIFDKCYLSVDFVGGAGQPPTLSITLCPGYPGEFWRCYTHCAGDEAGDHDLYASDDGDDEGGENEDNVHPSRWVNGPLNSAAKGKLMEWLDPSLHKAYFDHPYFSHSIEDDIDEEWENRDKDDDEDGEQDDEYDYDASSDADCGL